MPAVKVLIIFFVPVYEEFEFIKLEYRKTARQLLFQYKYANYPCLRRINIKEFGFDVDNGIIQFKIYGGEHFPSGHTYLEAYNIYSPEEQVKLQPCSRCSRAKLLSSVEEDCCDIRYKAVFCKYEM